MANQPARYVGQLHEWNCTRQGHATGHKGPTPLLLGLNWETLKTLKGDLGNCIMGPVGLGSFQKVAHMQQNNLDSKGTLS